MFPLATLHFRGAFADSGQFSLVEALVADDPPCDQLNDNFIAALDHMHMRGSVVLGVDYYIVSMSLPVQYCNHACLPIFGGLGWLSSRGFRLIGRFFGAWRVDVIESGEHSNEINAFVQLLPAKC